MFKPFPLNLPAYPLRIMTDGQRHFVFDELRKKRLVLTPEEWVRQHWIQHLIHEKSFPKSLLKAEDGISLNGLSKRSDLVAYNNRGQKILLAEFKKPSIQINQAVIDQISRYNLVYQIPLLMVSNGLQHVFWTVDVKTKAYRFLEDLPDYNSLDTTY